MGFAALADAVAGTGCGVELSGVVMVRLMRLRFAVGLELFAVSQKNK